MRHALLIVLVSFTSGCGLVFQGTRQHMQLTTDPPGASVEFRGTRAVTPHTVDISRRSFGLHVYRAEKPGYFPSCRVVDCGTPKWIKVLDSLPAALPLLVDLAAGALGNCDQTALTLEPMKPGDVKFDLPSDDDILGAGEGDDEESGLRPSASCLYPYLYDPAFAEQAARIVVSTGALQQPTEILGNVDFGRLGFDRTDAGAVAVHGFVIAWAHRTFSKATPAEINDLLRKQALHLYGTRVDALINVNYQSDPANNVFATGVAVHFVSPEVAGPSAMPDAGTRLRVLDNLRKQDLIDQREYEQKRTEILRGL